MLGSKERSVKESFSVMLSIHPFFILQTQDIQGRERVLKCKVNVTCKNTICCNGE